MKTILVSGASGIVGFGILRSLRLANRDYTLLGSSIYEESVAAAFCDTFIQAPRTDQNHYNKWLFDSIRQHRIDLLIPGIEVDMFAWTKIRAEIEKNGAKAALNQPELTALCGDKWDFFKVLQQRGFQCAIESSLSDRFEELESSLGLPFIVKPRRGYGSRDVNLISREDDFRPRQKEMGVNLLAQKFVGSGNEEYTTAVFGDGLGGFTSQITFKRELSKQGFTEKARVSEAEPFAETVHGLCQLFKPIGPTNFQFRKDGETIKLLEINPRISSSTSLRAAFGYNESLMAAEYFLHGHLPVQPAIRRGVGLRYPNDYIIYEDSNHF